MRAHTHKLVIPACLGVAALLSGCFVPPSSQSQGFDERLVFLAAGYHDPYDAAMAAAETELAEQQAAIEFLRKLAGRYRLALRTPDTVPNNTVQPEEIAKNALAIPVAASPGRAGPRMSRGNTSAALRETFYGSNGIDVLVNRCLDVMAANADKPTYSPKLFDWLCRAAILPEATASLDDANTGADELASLASDVDRLLRLEEFCRAWDAPECRDAGKLITQVIAQQPVAPVPQYLNKISVESTAVPVAAPSRRQSN